MNTTWNRWEKAVATTGGLFFLAATVAQAAVFTLGEFASGGPWGYTDQNSNPKWIQAQNQSGATGTYIKAMGQTFTTPNSAGAPIALTAFSLNFGGPHTDADINNTYSLLFSLYTSTDRSTLLMTQTGTYVSWGWNSHWTTATPSGGVGEGWMFSGLSVGNQPTLAGNTPYYFEVQIISSARDSVGLNVTYRSDSAGMYWTDGGAYVRMSDGGLSPQAWWEINPAGADSDFVAQFTTVPEPAALSLLALGALGLLHRRRR